MKKAISLILTIALLFSLMPAGTFTLTAEAATVASGKCGTNLTWTLDSAGTLTISGSGMMTDFNAFNIPWYNYCDSVKMVIIGNSVTSIGDWAFSNCKNMTSVTIGSSVTKIGKQAFEGCNGLTTVNIPASVTNIGVDAFYTCGNLTAFNVDANNTAYSSDASGVLFNKDKSSLILCPNGKTGIYTIPNSVMDIGANAFKGCAKLTGVEIPDSVKTIAYFAFGWCENLASIDIPDSVTSLGMYAFYKCYGLTSAKIGVSVTDMGDYTFEGCSELAEITFYGDAPSFGSYAFSGVTATAYYPADNNTWTADVMKNYGGTITWMSNEKEPDVTMIASGTCGDNLTWTLDNEGTLTISGTGNMYNFPIDSKPSPWHRHRHLIENIIIENEVTSIGSYAFYHCDSLAGVSLGNSLQTIGTSAFWYCTSLTNVTIPDSVNTLGSYAFDRCSSLDSVTLGKSLQTIGECAFSYCKSLTSITIPDSVTKIDTWAFYDTNLKEISFEGSAPTIDSHAFSSVTATAYYYPNETWTADVMQNYGGTIAWEARQLFSQGLDFELSFDQTYYIVIGIGTCADTEIIIPDTHLGKPVKAIGGGAFLGETTITSVVIPDSVTRIGNSAFYKCTGLTTVSIGNGVETIDNYAFFNCAGLTTVTLGNSVETISDFAFRSCTSLTLVTIPDSVTQIGDAAFDGTGLIMVTLGNSVKTIGDYAFYGCPLTTLTIPDSVTNIGNSAFWACTRLEGVYFNGSAPAMGKNVFRYVTTIAYYYPDETWTADVMQNYGGTITWVAMGSDAEGATLSGSYISFGEAVNAVTIQLIPTGGTESAYAFVSDGTASTGVWSIEGVAEGTYTVRVIKTNHVTREYTLTVGERDTELDLEIWLLGDVTGDGLVNFSDYSKVLSQSKNPSGGDLSGYAWLCGDVTGDSIINFSDYSQVLAQAKGSGRLWED